MPHGAMGYTPRFTDRPGDKYRNASSISVCASRFVTTLLYGLQPRDPATLVLAALALIGAMAGWIPALRAARIDPASVLREGVRVRARPQTCAGTTYGLR